MFHKAVALRFLEGTRLQVTFQNGEIKEYDVSVLYGKYAALEALNNHDLFAAGKLMGAYGIVWNEELDLEAETIYEDGVIVGSVELPAKMVIGNALAEERNRQGLSQKSLASMVGMDQSDLSKIERGAANPSIATLEKIAAALGKKLALTLGE